MPRGDGSGPNGMGPMTGRGAGYCTGFDRPGYANPVPGAGFGRGAGGGRGRGWRWRNQFYATGVPGWRRFGYPPGAGAWGAPQPPTPEQETETLKAQAQWLQQQLDVVNQRIEEFGQVE